jgi:hypothetical protein
MEHTMDRLFETVYVCNVNLVQQCAVLYQTAFRRTSYKYKLYYTNTK